ncbi:ATP-binding cassette domain-containing protein [Frankia sp. CNm7]|uniref:ATP-binding cassette domain-containing protein n=1 Tax=Frankia nepalensis TaxID=1836974 RepID=A0A937RMN7_9ACTN|nr:ATP-binding cassette domain-containing protein [Frankia nepalensis]MBL7497804.1 ATP-binding cassette domain-containing protein [Frankia nepalensis]MBL7512666.1 ATP-binding cassette domain-containing protein [Frankia nepalensis]MBL7523191.1 ATP-binding cassette domain-containing protein [Frankia nepalensis]MBL7631705.1 ATP-binding cassette domain-containing protein [Frankia nepalensis]
MSPFPLAPDQPRAARVGETAGKAPVSTPTATAAPSLPGAPSADAPTLEVRDLTVRYGGTLGCADVGFDLLPGEVLGIVGESGSGKSTVLGCCALDLSPTSGVVRLSGQDTAVITGARRRRLRYAGIGIVRQASHEELRLAVSAGGNIAERLLATGQRSFDEIRDRVAEVYREVELPAGRMDAAVATFSGGMRQRVQIARALVNEPAVLLLDEPTTGLDVSVQARILDLIRRLQRQTGVAMVIVSHDLAVIRMLADRLLVMRAGRVVESGVTDRVLSDPRHPYTQLLVSSQLES